MAETTQIHPDKVRAYLATDYRLGHAAQRAVLYIEQRSERLAMLCADNGVKCGTLWSGLILSDHRKRCCPSGWDQRRRGAILLPSPNQGTKHNIAGESDFVKPLNPYFLTAHNARGTIRPDEVNDRAHVQLAAKLQELGPQAIEGSGSEEGTDWAAEECYFALGLALEPAKAMGTHFDQDAIVWVGPDAVPQLILLC